MNMKRLIPILVVSCAIPLGLSAQQQGGPAIKVTTTVHSDGTQTILKTDPESHTAESRTIDASQKTLQRTVYTTDDQGQYTGASIFDSQDRLLFKSTYTRDAANRVTEQVDTTADGKPVRKLVFEYDARGRLSRVRTFDGAGNETTPMTTKKQAPASKRHSGSRR
jgi:hypothetical protein